MKHYLLLLLTLQFACHSFGLYTPRLAKKPSYSAQVLRATPISAEVVESILSKAVGKALEGGTAGASAAAVQVLAFTEVTNRAGKTARRGKTERKINRNTKR